MRAVVIHAPKDLRIDTVAEPELKPGEVLVRLKAGGICGSDLHYYNHGGFGTIRIREPMALGHEIAGVVEAVGAGVNGVAPGARVAINPSRPCDACRYCRMGMRNQCLDMRFMGSAMRFPHVQGGFRECVAVDAAQAVPIAAEMTMGEAAMAEPLSVCLHAASQAGDLRGRSVLITGCGPIGALCVIVAKHFGAAEIVVTDVLDAPLAVARDLGAMAAVNIATNPGGLDAFKADKGHFDVLFEASGNQAAMRGGLDLVRPGATIVQLGLGGDMTLPMNVVVAKEIRIAGSFRFDVEFGEAVRLMGSGAIDVKPLISATLPFTDAVEAFERAGDKARSMKVHLAF